MANNNIKSGVMLAFVCLCILSVMPVISNGRPAGFSALSFAFFLSVWQVVFALPLFVLELRLGRKGIFGAGLTHRKAGRSVAVMVMTGAMFGLSTYLYVLGVEKAGAGSAAVAIQAYPMFAILLEALFLKRRKTATELGLTGLLVATLYYLATGGTLRLDGISPWFLVSLGVPLLWSIAHIIIKEELGRMPISPVQVTFFRVVISSGFLAVMLAVIEPSGLVSGAASAGFQGFAMIMGLVYFLELVVWFYAVRQIDVSLASSITTPWPAFTMILAAVLLGEEIAAYQITAFVVVALSIYGLIFASLRKPPIQPA